MHECFIKLFIKQNKAEIDDKLRLKLGNFSSYVGIAANTSLFVIKLVLGMLTLSLALKADAFNNLIDMISSIIALVGFKIANKPADSEHPFGHGRIEIISDLLVGILIAFFGLQLIKVSYDKIVLGYHLNYRPITIYILILTIIIKLWHSSFVKYVGDKIDSSLLITTAKDSFNDAIVTSVVIISLIFEHYFNLKIDGYLGLLLAVYIIYSGIKSIVDSSKQLLGKRISDERIIEMEKQLLSYDNILGFHDLIVHKYGHNQYFASVHVEVNSKYTLIFVHDIIDKIEYDFKELLNVNLVVHPDPIILDDPEIVNYQSKIKEIVYCYNQDYSIHDFRLVKYQNYNLILFDLVVDEESKSDFEIKNVLKAKILNIYPQDKVKIVIDRNYLLGVVDGK